MVQLSHLYVTNGKTLTIWTFVGKVMSLLFNTLFRLVIAFLPRSKFSVSEAQNCPGGYGLPAQADYSIASLSKILALLQDLGMRLYLMPSRGCEPHLLHYEWHQG